jgi:hypothetical protein
MLCLYRSLVNQSRNADEPLDDSPIVVGMPTQFSCRLEPLIEFQFLSTQRQKTSKPRGQEAKLLWDCGRNRAMLIPQSYGNYTFNCATITLEDLTVAGSCARLTIALSLWQSACPA